jgi:general secretion pathway protein A
MYEEFYGFRDNPFRLTPDPDYLFLSVNHQEALGHLLFGVREGSGVVVITGEIGAGKTTLLRTLVRNLDDNTIVAYIFNPALSAVELLQTLNADLELPSSSTSKKELIDDLNRFLLEQQAAGRRVVVIVDEAQDLEPSVLEQLRLLSNLETERDKLLQIMLVGQPELRDILARPDLAQLDQRVTLKWHLGPLDEEETTAYIRHRIRVAADGREPVQLSKSAHAAVYRISHGIPRIINVLCHRALLIGYTREERHIDRATIMQAAQELGRDGDVNARTFLHSPLSPLLTGVLIFLSTAILVFASTQGWLPTKTRPSSPDSLAALAPQSTSPAESKEKSINPPPHAEQTVGPPMPPPSVTEKADTQGQSQAPDLAPPTSTQGTLPSEPLPTLSVAAISQKPNQEVSEREVFLQPLQQMTIVDSAVRATNGLLQIWGVPALQNTEWQRGALDLSALARTRHLEYLPVNGAITLLSLLDLPAILELTTPDRHELRFALLLGITGDRCRILLDGEQEVPLKILNDYWLGKAHLFWKDFENVGAPLAVGSVGQQVRRLYRLLSQAPGINARLSPEARLDTFSRQTEEIVARFQKSRRLAPDGVVGPQTMITLYNTVAGYTRPSLKTANSVAQASRESPKQEEEQPLPNASEDRRRKVHEHNS